MRLNLETVEPLVISVPRYSLRRVGRLAVLATILKTRHSRLMANILAFLFGLVALRRWLGGGII